MEKAGYQGLAHTQTINENISSISFAHFTETCNLEKCAMILLYISRSWLFRYINATNISSL
jgi:hypothetical protein